MKVNSREVYGFGTSLSTRHRTVAKWAHRVMYASVAGMVLVLLWT